MSVLWLVVGLLIGVIVSEIENHHSTRKYLQLKMDDTSPMQIKDGTFAYIVSEKRYDDMSMAMLLYNPNKFKEEK